MANTFLYPIPDNISNDRIRLDPFDPKVHGPAYLAAVSPHPELFYYLPYGPMNAQSDLDAFYHARIASDPASILFAIITKTATDRGPAGSLAGVIGLLFAKPDDAVCEVGHVMIFPPFQRSYVNTNAVGLLLRYLLDTPDQTPGSLGLRRVVWQAVADNTKSVGAAKRIGWHFEGNARWQRVLPTGKYGGAGVPARETEGVEGRTTWGPGRHTAVLSMCWDDWECGKREFLQGLMDI